MVICARGNVNTLKLTAGVWESRDLAVVLVVVAALSRTSLSLSLSYFVDSPKYAC